MDQKFLEFAILLRKAGVKVSHSEIAECLQALSMVGLEKANVYDAMAATLIKDQSDFRIFDKLFYFYFDPDFFGHRAKLQRWPKLVRPPRDRQCAGGDRVPGSEPGRPTGFGHGQGLATSAIDDFLQVIKVGSPAAMAELIRKGVAGLGPIEETDLREMKDTVRQVKVFLEWNMGVYRLEQEAGTVYESIWLTWQERLAEMEDMLRRELEKAIINDLGDQALETILIRENLNQLDFYRLSQSQVAEIKKKISKLAHKLASRLSFRQKRAKRGQIDLQRTIRKSMSTGGVPIKPAYRDRYPTRPELVVLCDVSGSVRLFSEFMLQLVYSIQNRFIHVRSFVFVDTPDEVTALMQNREIKDGIKDMYNQARFANSAFSDYGRMFFHFWDKYLPVLTRKTTLLIIGDARNNYHQAEADYLEKIGREVKKVIWLNPEPFENWDREDSIMSVYGRLCHQVFECRNLEQLDNVAKKII